MILSRYLIKELLSRVFLALFSLYLILLVSQILRISALISSLGFSFSNIIQPLFYISMTHLGTLVPIAFFLGVLLTVRKLAEDEELTIILSSGKSLFRIVRPFFYVGLFFFSFCLVSSNFLESHGKKKLLAFIEERALEKIKSVLEQKIEEDVFVEIFRDYYLYADKIAEDKTFYEGVILVPKNHGGGTNSVFISAKKAEPLSKKGNPSVILKFTEGTLFRLSSLEDSGYFVMNFSSFEVDFLTGIHSQIGADKNYSDMTKAVSSFEIYEKLKTDSMGDPVERTKLVYLLFTRLFSPLLLLAFCFWGVFLGIYNVRRDKNAVYFSFFSLLLLTQALTRLLQWLSERTLTRPELIVPLFYILFFLTSFWFLYKKNKRPLWEPFKLFS